MSYRFDRKGPLLATVLLLCSSGHAQSLPNHIRTVRADAQPGGNGLSWETAFNDLQNALTAAAGSSGQVSEVWVATGIYRPPPSTACAGFVASEVSIFGGFSGTESSTAQRPSWARSTLTADQMVMTNFQCGFLLTMSGSAQVALDGFYLDGANRASGLRLEAGGAISNVVVRANTGPLAARALEKLSPQPLTIARCDFESMSSQGTLRIAGPCTVIGSRIRHSGPLNGNGILADTLIARDSILIGSGDVAGAIVADHIDAENCDLQGSGGAIRAMSFNSGVLRGCSLTATSDHGVWLGAVRAVNSTITSTSSYTPLALSGAQLDGCVLRVRTRDHPAIVSGPLATFYNCTFLDLNGYLNFESSWRMYNCIVWSESGPPAGGLVRFPQGASNLVNYSCVQGWTGVLGGAGNFGSDPLLSTGGVPSPSSPCLDAGLNAYIPSTLTRDIAGNCRIASRVGSPSPVVDMGAYELGCAADCDCSLHAATLTVADFTCFLQRFAEGDEWANCDGSSIAPALNVADFTCYLRQFAAGCN